MVEAWLGRQCGHFRWHVDDFLYWFDVEVSGQSITHGEYLVTRAHDGFIALLNGKRFRALSLKTELQFLQNSHARHQVPGFVVPPPHSWPWVGAEEFDRWYRVLRRWQTMPSAEAAAEYTTLAERLVDAFLDGDEWTHYDGYRWAEASVHGVFAWCECLATRSPEEHSAILVSARDFRRGHFKPMLRDSVKLVLAHRGFRIHDVRPRTRAYATTADLWVAWT